MHRLLLLLALLPGLALAQVGSGYGPQPLPGGGGGSGVASFNGRTGAISPAANDYSFSQLSGIPTTCAGYGITGGCATAAQGAKADNAGAVNGLLKSDGAATFSAATAGIDYALGTEPLGTRLATSSTTGQVIVPASSGLNLDASGNLRYNGTPQFTGCLAGDSRVQRNIDQASVGANGGYTIKNEPYWFTTTNWLMGQPFVLLNNAGVNSDTTAGLLARITTGNVGSGFGALGSSAVAVTTNPGCLGLSTIPKYTFVAIGINDILAGTSASTIMGAGGIGCTSGILCIWQQATQRGSTVIAMTIEPATSAQGTWTTATSAQWYLLNQAIKLAAVSTPGVILADVNSVPTMVDTTNAALTGVVGLYADGTLHENSLGAYYKAKAIKAALAPYIPPVNYYLAIDNAATSALSATIPQILVNPLLMGTATCTGTGMSGTGPNVTGITYVNSSGTTSVCSVETRSDGYGQNLVLDITSTTSTGNIEVRWPDQHTAVALSTPNQRWVGAISFCVTGPGGANLTSANNFSFMRLAIQYNDGATNIFRYDGDSTYPANYNESFCASMQTRPMTIPNAGTPTTFKLFFDAQFSGSGEAIIHLGRPTLTSL